MNLRRVFLLLWMTALGLPPFGRVARAQDVTPPPLVVTAPRPGEALQGTVDILIEVPRGSPMAFGGLYFGYAQDASGVRFPIWEAEAPRGGDPLTQWDTTMLTDGDYTLYLLIRLENGETLQATIPDLRVRNYTPIETPTPTLTSTPLPGAATPTPTHTPTLPPPTATPLPPNPASLTPAALAASLRRAALFVLGAFLLLGIYRWLRRERRG